MSIQFLRPYRAKSKVRAGRTWDGGYVLEADSLKSVEVIYSYGVGWEVSFEKALYRMMKKTVRIFDPTMFDLSTLSRSRKRGAYQFFKYLAKVVYFRSYLTLLPILGYDIKFYNEGIASGRTEKYDSFSNHLVRFGDQGKKILLKIDIEDGEYAIFKDPAFLNSLEHVVQLAIEFHSLDSRLEDLRAILKSLESRFTLVHIHSNNFGTFFDYEGLRVPTTIEVALLNNTYLVEKVVDTTELPLPGLDFPNDPNVPDFSFSKLFR